MVKQGFILMAIIFLSACKSYNYVKTTSQFEHFIEKNKVSQFSFTGFCLYDLYSKSYLIHYQDDKYFTPASNVKLLTLLSGLKILGNAPNTTVDGLRYALHGDSLIFCGTGDPTLLHLDFSYQKIFNLLKKSDKKLFYFDSNWHDTSFGNGWSWDDYTEYYSAEKSPLPLYGNVVRVEKDTQQALSVVPSYFQKYFLQDSNLTQNTVTRKQFSNNFTYFKPDETDIPYLTSGVLTANLLSEALQKEVGYLRNYPLQTDLKTISSIAADTLYRKMLQESDNFMAEQILILCANKLNTNDLNSKNAIDFVQKKYLSDLSQPPRWVDGSGLSRLNLATPRSMVEVLLKIYQEIAPNLEGEVRLFSLFSAGGQSGTLRNFYNASPPFLFAKTGTLSNNHNLSGFFRTKSGKLLCFSWMNNHFMTSSADIKKQMEEVLTNIYLKY